MISRSWEAGSARAAGELRDDSPLPGTGTILDHESAAITGIGVVSSIGTGFEAFLGALRSGSKAGGPLTLFEERDAPPVAEAKVFELEDHIETVKTYIDRTSAFALAACAMARNQAGWSLDEEGERSAGLSLGTAWGCAGSTELYARKFVNSGPKLVPPLIFIHSYANAPNSIISIEYNIRGFNACLTGGHASGLQAVSYGADQIRLGRTRYLLAGGADSLTRFVLQGYRSEGRLAGESQPFDRNSTGFLLSEGAAVLAMEPASQAGPRALAQIVGTGRGPADDGPDGAVLAMRRALDEAGLSADELGLILAAGAGEPELDELEAQAIGRLVESGGAAIPVFALKALTGEPMAAGGPMAVAAAIGILTSGELPPLDRVPESRLPDDTRGRPNGAVTGRVALVNAISRGGDICSVVVRRP